MSERPFLLEIGLEEMPARFIPGAAEQLSEKIAAFFAAEKIDYEGIRVFATPRRLAVFVEAVAEKQRDVTVEIKGPAKKAALDPEGNWTKAALGFTKSQGMTVDDIYFKTVNGAEYCFVKKVEEGKPVPEVLPKIAQVIESMAFPKNMRWADLPLRFVRPIRWILAKYGNETVPFSVAGVKSGPFTSGHRFLGKKIEVDDPKNYERLLRSQYVICDYEERKREILRQLERLEREREWAIPVDGELLDEVTHLVEYPQVFYGSFDESFLHLPEKVLITTMKEHQRYFPVRDREGRLLPHFVAVRNGDDRHLETVRRGNEKVLRARLQDAAFFYREDQKLSIEEALKRLSPVIYHDRIGSYAEKISRIVRLTEFLLGRLPFAEEERRLAVRAAQICKFDLVTQMVYEFPELEGYMGENYALLQKEDERVAKAINEHYQPRNAEDGLPESDIGAVLAVADKLETLASFFAIGSVPSGSQDPYGLRRLATGVIDILHEKGWDIPLADLLKEAIRLTSGFADRPEEEIFAGLADFFRARLKHKLQGRGFRYDIVDAVLSASLTDVRTLARRAELFNEKKDEPGFKEDMESLIRVVRIAKKAESAAEVNPELFENETEGELYRRLLEAKDSLPGNGAEDYYRALVALKPYITAFFDRTMVMAEDERLRSNRLAMMRQLADLILNFADVEELVIK